MSPMADRYYKKSDKIYQYLISFEVLKATDRKESHSFLDLF